MHSKCSTTLVHTPEGKSIELKNDALVKIFFAPDADRLDALQKCICGKVYLNAHDSQ